MRKLITLAALAAATAVPVAATSAAHVTAVPVAATSAAHVTAGHSTSPNRLISQWHCC